MKIGITINIGSNNSIWSNGVNQNAVFLALIFKKIGYDVNLIYANSSKKTEDVLKKYNINLKLITLKNSFDIKYDVIIQLGLTIEEEMYNKWKSSNNNLKTVAYECGNHWFIESEKIIFGAHDGNNEDNLTNGKFNQVWSIPQMEKTCLDLYAFLRKTDNATVVPFIWDPIFIETHSILEDYNLEYGSRKIKKIGVMEPNISIMKNSIYPIVILDKYYRKYKQLEKIYLIGADKIKNNKSFKKLISKTDLLKNNILTAERRYQTLYLLDNYVDLVLSWQFENNLNYLWFDIAWMGWPIVHNGSLCQDIGYYYKDFKVDNAIEKIKEASEEHANNLNYKKINRSKIKRYTNENYKLIEQYKELIEDLVNDRFRKRKYNWKTNTIT